MSQEAKRKAARSGTMCCPICGKKAMLVEHHIHGREIPHASASWNRCYICPVCHDEVHAGRIIIEGWGMTSMGKVLIWRIVGVEAIKNEGAEPPLYSNSTRILDAFS